MNDALRKLMSTQVDMRTMRGAPSSSMQMPQPKRARPRSSPSPEKVSVVTERPLLTCMERCPLPIDIDAKSSLLELISRGKYDVVDENIRYFALLGGEWAPGVHLCRSALDAKISSVVVLAGLSEMGLAPAGLGSLLAFGAKYPETQREFTTVALGARETVGGRLCVPVLQGPDRRRLNVQPWGGDWPSGHRFLAVPR